MAKQRVIIRRLTVIGAVMATMPRLGIKAQGGSHEQRVAVCEVTVDAKQWIDKTGHALFVEYPSVVSRKDLSLVTGYPAALYERAPSGRPSEVSLGVVEEKGLGFATVQLPGRRRQRYWPRAAASEGMVHVVWGEDTATVESYIPQVRQLWHMYHDGSKWSVPEMIWSSGSFTWDPGEASDLHATAAGVALAVPATVGRESGVLYLERLRGRWVNTFISHRGLPGQTELTSLRDGRSVVVFIAADVNAPGVNSNSVFATIVRPVGRGARADAIERVHFSGLGAAYSPQVHDMGRNGVSLFWLQADSGTDRATSILTASSRMGSHWNEGAAVSLPVGLDGLHSSGTSSTVRLISTTTQRGRHPIYLEWTSGRWSTPVVLSSAAAQTTPRLVTVHDTTFVVWSSAIPLNAYSRERAPVTWRVPAPVACPNLKIKEP